MVLALAKAWLWLARSDHLSRSTHSHNTDVALTSTGFSKIWQSLQFLLLSSQMVSGRAWILLFFLFFITEFEWFWLTNHDIICIQESCRFSDLCDTKKNQKTNSQPHFLSSNRFSISFFTVLSHFLLGWYLNTMGFKGLYFPPALHQRVCVWRMVWGLTRVATEQVESETAEFTDLSFWAELKVIAL